MIVMESRRSFTKKYDKDSSIYERENIDCMASSHPEENVQTQWNTI